MRKAERDGAGMYKGYKLASWTPRFEPQTSGARPLARVVPQQRVKVVQWNVGGFSAELQMEWFAWLRQDPSIVFILIETHWSFTNEYQAENWTLVHSGTEGKRGAGVMTGIRTDLVDTNTLRWRAVEPGRLLHVRCHIKRQQFDIVGLYQHALARVEQEKQAELMRKRARIWKQLDSTITGFPFRSSVLVAGDFNMVFKPFAEVAGSGIKAGSDVQWLAQERDEVMNLLQTSRLVALNTW